MLNYPVIVIGPPRSGTTSVARMLQEWYGILMDGDPKPVHPIINPHGWFEDRRLEIATNMYYDGKITIEGWMMKVLDFGQSMRRINKAWGMKDPMLVPFLSLITRLFDESTIIRCHRPKELVVASMMKKLGWAEKNASDRYDRDERMLNEQLKDRPHYRIDFDKHIAEEIIIDLFENSMVLRNVAES
jgi:hypothetical protein